MKIDKILVPTDFSPSSEPALLFAVDVARATGASLTLVYAYNPTPYEIPEGIAVSPFVQLGGLTTEFRQLLEVAKQKAEERGATRVDTLLAQGAAHSEIVRIAEKQGCGLIVMGTHGRTGIAHAVLGSVAERVVRKAPCPVITVPMPRDMPTRS